MKILLTGKNGQVGFELQRALAPLGELVALDHAGCDLADPDAIRRAVRSHRPDLIVNAAAYTAVDRAESEVEAAQAVNAVAPGILGEEAARINARVLHYSTDYVFSGEESGWYSEEDMPAPRSVYGSSKLAGEQALQKSGADYLILRTSWVLGAHGSNFAKTILRFAAERDELRVVNDQFGAPTSAALIADVSAQLVRRLAGEEGKTFPFGLYHLAAAGETNWHEYACFVVEEALRGGKQMNATPERILAVPASEYQTVAARPANSRLDTGRLRTTFNLTLPHWKDGVRHVLQQLS